MTRLPNHPGEILGEKLKEIGISASEIARQIKALQNRISQIIAGKRSITGETALRLGCGFRKQPRVLADFASLLRFARGPAGGRQRIEALPVMPDLAAT